MQQGNAPIITVNAARPEGHRDDFRFLAGGGEMGERIRALDWSRTPLGPIAAWPQSLRTAVGICLRSRFPIILWWGADLTVIYNDAYIPIFAGKHPHALGAPGLSRDAWGDPEVRAVIEPMLRGVIERGDATWSDDQLLILERKGFSEEAYFTWSYSPIQDESGQVGGVFTAVTETTEKVVGQRRLGILRDLADRALEAKTTDEAYANAAAILSQHPLDLPFFLLYVLDDRGEAARLVGASIMGENGAPRPETISLLDAAEREWPLDIVATTGRETVIADVIRRVGQLPGGPWPEAPHTALALPIIRPGQRVPYGVLIAGISPRCPFDADYTSFLRFIAGQIATAISNVLAYEQERKRAEALAEIDRAKTTFFSNVSHEFRTPLTLMLGPLTDALRESEMVPANRERLDVAHRNALRLLRLVNSLLDFSRIEAGRVEATYEPTDLAAYTADLASGFRSAIERVGMALIVECPPLAEPVYVDWQMWEKIVLNLLSNAFKYTLEGRITVSLREREGAAVLSVADTGVGIPAPELPHMFERFHRVQGSAGRTHEGTGIGLSLVHEFVHVHGGTMTVESAPGVGSTFTVSLPLGTAHLPADRIAAARTPASAAIGARAFVEEALRWLPGQSDMPDIIPDLPPVAAFGGDEPQIRQATHPARILLADDNTDMRDYVTRLLRERYVVEAVADGEAALAAIERRRPDLVLTDVMMPRTDGFALVRALRADPATRTLPIVMLSARAGEEASIAGRASGADDYLVKPFSARELLARVGAQLDLATSRAEARRAAEDERTRLYELFMQAPAIIAVLRGPEHVFELANPLYMQIIGEKREIIGKRVREALPEIESQEFLALLDRVYRTGEPYVGDETPVRLDRQGDGTLEERFLNFVYQPYKDADGAAQGILVHAVDATDQVRARRRVEEQNHVLEMITQGASIAEALDFLVRSLERQAAGRMRASILLLDSDGTHLRHGAAPSLPDAYNAAINGIEIGPNVGSCGTAAFTRAPVIVSDIASDPLWADFRDLAGAYGLRACWSTPIFSADGDVLGTFAMYYDEPREPSEEDRQLITFATRTTALLIERKRGEEAVRESERRFRAMINALPAAIYTTDAEGRLTHFNPAAVAFSGRVPELGTDQWCVSWKLYYPDGTPMPHGECPMAIALKEGRIITDAEAIAERPDGTRVWFTPYPTPLRDAEGRIVGGINMLVDITERKRADEMRARLAAIVEWSDDAIVSKDLTGTIMTWNKGAEQIFGFTAEEAVGQPITILIPPDHLSEETEILRRIRGGESVDHIETVRRRKDGTLLDISLTVSPIMDGRGGIVGASKIARDITERRALERQKDAFIGIAAHELRTPVTGIKGYGQLLARRLRRAGDTASAETLDKLNAQADRLTGLIEDLLDVTRIESGALPLRPAPFDLDALIMESVEEAQRTAERHMIVPDLGAPVTLVADRDRIGQVVSNLLTNAIKYSPQADRVVVRTRRDGEQIVVSVRDDGIGIPKEDQSRIFERFYRVDADNRAGYAGLGLGLYIAAEFVTRHGGAIWVESEKGAGTTISFSLPLGEPRDGRAAVGERSA